MEKHQTIRHFRVDTEDHARINDYPSVSFLIDTQTNSFRVIARRPPAPFDKKMARRILENNHPLCNPVTVSFEKSGQDFLQNIDYRTQNVGIEDLVGVAREAMHRTILDHVRELSFARMNALCYAMDTIDLVQHWRKIHRYCDKLESMYGDVFTVDRQTLKLDFGNH